MTLLPAQESRNDRLGLPALAVATDNPPSLVKIALGQALFFDKRLSGDGTISCASCHQPERAFTDGRVLAIGISDQVSVRNTPTLLNAAFNTSQFWDGRRASLEEQAADPFVNPQEHGLKDETALLNLITGDPAYMAAFQAAFKVAPDAIRINHISKAVASFEQTLIAGGSAFDRFYFKKEQSALSPAAARGLALFKGSAQCVTCHTIGKSNALFTDNQFHSLNVGLSRIAQRLPALTTYLAQAQASGANLDHMVLSDRDIAELGRFATTLAPSDIGKFRTPSLRNVALTAPYMHDGSVATLEDAVELEIYYRSAESGRPLILTPVEKADLVEFLKSLDSPESARFTNLQKSMSTKLDK